MNFICFAIWFWKYVISFFLRKILNRMNWADFPMMVKKKSEKLETLGIQMIIQHASICATMILFFLAKIAYKDLRILRFKIWKSKLFAYKHINHYLGQWIARSQNMGSNLDPDLLPKKRSDPIQIRSFPIFHWRSFQIFSDPFRSFPIYQPWVFTIFIIVKIYFNDMFGNWYMSKISMHQNIYHLYLILEKLAQKMEKNKNL